MLKLGHKYRVKTWKQLEKAAQGKYADDDLDFGNILFTNEMRDLCGKKLTIISRDINDIYGVAEEWYKFTEDMFVKSKLRELIEVRNEV